MSLFDYLLPHRLFINNALRKQSSILKNQIISYQAEYENKIKLCRIEIYNKQQEKNKEYEVLKNKVVKDLNNTKASLNKLGVMLKQYVDEYLRLQCLYETLNLIKTERDIVYEDICFLMEQKSLITEEIEILKERKEQLLEISNVEDIIHLAKISGCEFGFNFEDNAKTLLDKINEAIESLSDDSIKSYSLKKLRRIVQERVEYLILIKYISCQIKQKKQAINNINKNINSTNETKRKIQLKVDEIYYKIEILKEKLIKLAKKIRYHLEKPIISLSESINNTYIKFDKINERIQKKFSEIEDIKSKLRYLANTHSSNQYSWNFLKERKSKLKSDLNNLFDERNKIFENIKLQKKERDFLYKKIHCIKSSLYNNNIHLLSEKKYTNN